jgi:hypothetical protein
MGSSTSPSTTTNVATTTIPSIISRPISEKLTKMNYPLWHAQVLPAICVAQYEGLLTGTDLAPAKQVIITP